MLSNNLKKTLKFVIITASWLGLWQILSAIAGLSVLFPSPVETLFELKALVVTKDFWLSVFHSLIRIFTGFCFGVLAGTLTAFFSAFFKYVNDFLAPFIYIIKATPVASFIILAVVWLKTNNVPSFTVMLIVFPIVWSNVTTGLKETDRKLLEMSDAFGVKKSRKIRKIYLPSVKPYFISALTTAMGLAWKAGIAAEVICTPKLSIGSGIYSSKIYLETPQLFAWTAVVVLMSIILEKIILRIMRRRIKHDNTQ